MIKSDEAYRNTCCMCCGIPLVNARYFQKEDGTLVLCTVDHVLLRSLNGSNASDNLVLMCHDCNQLRGNLFAELDEFIFWYWSDKPLPKQKNFSYLRERPRNKEYSNKYKLVNNYFVKSSSQIKNNSSVPKNNKIKIESQSIKQKVIPVLLPKSSSSILVGTIELNGYKYNQYKHPLFGKSLVKVE